MPEIPDGIYIAVISGLVAVILAVLGWLRFRPKDRVEVEAQKQVALSERFDDASSLAKYIDQRVEEKVKPIRDELERVKRENHEVSDAFRTWVSAVWLWHQRGRRGDLPMPPVAVLSRLGLAHFADDWPTEPTPPTRRSS